MQSLVIAEKSYPIIHLPGRPPAILDRHVAEIYQVETKRVNESVRNNPEKFPEDFCFQLTKEEMDKVENFDLTSSQWFTHAPWCFSWEGCNMLATVLKSDIATERAIQIVRGFTMMERECGGKYQDHPMIIGMRKALYLTEKYCELEEEQEKLAKMQQIQRLEMCEIAAKVNRVLSQSGFYSVLAYANMTGRKVSLSEAKHIGREASKLSRQEGISIDHVPDPRFGRINTYHQSILDRIFDDHFPDKN